MNSPLATTSIRIMAADGGRLPEADIQYYSSGYRSSGSAKDGNLSSSKQQQQRVPPHSPLQWTAGRRFCSEPGAQLVDSGRSSLTSYGSQESLFSSNNDEYEVFSDCYSEAEGSELDESITNAYDHSLSCYLDKWSEWTVYSSEINLGDNIVSSTCKETVQRGYWHGAVWVHRRSVTEQDDVHSFAHEVNTLCRIRHENIQLFMGVCLDLPGNAFGIIMSEVKGDSLYSHIHKHGHNFTTPSKLKILRQISEGMEYLHAKGICHGGLSSKLITIHHRVCISLSFHTMNHRNLDGFDLSYLSPDEIRYVTQVGKGQIYLPYKPTLTSDIFAFGTLTYELVTLRLPFNNQSLLDLVWNVGNNQMQSLALLPRSCFKTVISRCWSLSRRTSFKDVLSLIQDNTLLRFKSSSSLSVPTELCTVGK